jgi:hypothetical protein
MQLKAQLVDAVQNRQVVLFAGAGISWKSIGFGGEHIRNQLGEQIARDYKDYEIATRSVEQVCDEYAALNDRIALVDRLAALIPQDKAPQESHIAAVKAFRLSSRPTGIYCSRPRTRRSASASKSSSATSTRRCSTTTSITC